MDRDERPGLDGDGRDVPDGHTSDDQLEKEDGVGASS